MPPGSRAANRSSACPIAGRPGLRMCFCQFSLVIHLLRRPPSAAFSGRQHRPGRGLRLGRQAPGRRRMTPAFFPGSAAPDTVRLIDQGVGQAVRLQPGTGHKRPSRRQSAPARDPTRRWERKAPDPHGGRLRAASSEFDPRAVRQAWAVCDGAGQELRLSANGAR
jgi:hypothetical protein